MMRALTLAAAVAAATALYMPQTFGNSMVFQRGKPIQLFGNDTATGTTVTATFLGQKYNAQTDNNAFWTITLPAQPATATPLTVSVTSSAGGSLSLQDVLIGDVYLVSGQSNAGLQVIQTMDYLQVAAASVALGPLLRLCNVAPIADYANVTTPQWDLTMAVPWTRANNVTTPASGALAYYMAAYLLQNNGGADAGVPIGVINTAWGGEPIEVFSPPAVLQKCGETIDAEASAAAAVARRVDPGLDHAAMFPWMPPAAFTPYADTAAAPSKPGCLYYSMIVPFQRFALSGIAWYQGEANSGAPNMYECTFPGMITAWRQAWTSGTNGATDPNLPFVFVQLAPWPFGDTGEIAVMRYAQQAALALPKVGMAVAADIGDPSGALHPIHPPFKAEVGRRAGLWLQNVVYGNATASPSGPRILNVTVDMWDASWGNTWHYGYGGSNVCALESNGFSCMGIRVKFDQPIVVRTTGNMPPQFRGFDNGFVLQGANNVSQPVTLTGVRTDDPTTVQLNVTWIYGPGMPSTLLYGWRDYPTMPLANAADLPVIPFNVSMPAA